MLHSNHTHMIFNILPWKLTMKFFTARKFLRYVNQHHRHKLNNTPTINYLGHPINAYHLIRHIVYGWEYISHHLPVLMERRPLHTALGKVLKWIRYVKHLFLVIFLQWKWNDIPSFVYLTVQLRKRKTNVDINDVNGAAIGIIRLFSEYR